MVGKYTDRDRLAYVAHALTESSRGLASAKWPFLVRPPQMREIISYQLPDVVGQDRRGPPLHGRSTFEEPAAPVERLDLPCPPVCNVVPSILWRTFRERGREKTILYSDVDAPTAVGQGHFESARRFLLWRNMRAMTDKGFIEWLDKIRNGRIDESGLKKIHPLSASDLKDPSWMFAPVGCASNFERHMINRLQVERYAHYFDIPLVRWRVKIQKDGRRIMGAQIPEPEPTARARRAGKELY